jgi:hypothetical protein
LPSVGRGLYAQGAWPTATPLQAHSHASWRCKAAQDRAAPRHGGQQPTALWHGGALAWRRAAGGVSAWRPVRDALLHGDGVATGEGLQRWRAAAREEGRGGTALTKRWRGELDDSRRRGLATERQRGDDGDRAGRKRQLHTASTTGRWHCSRRPRASDRRHVGRQRRLSRSTPG